jgi:hypothetical protein
MPDNDPKNPATSGPLPADEPADHPGPPGGFASFSKPAYWQYPLQGGKYGKYFASGPKPGYFDQNCVVMMDEEVVPAGMFFLYTHESADFFNNMITHNPHVHPYPELMGFFSTDGNDPHNLGCTITIYMGEEMEMHSFTKPTVIYIPADLPHSPLVHRDMTRSVVFMFTFPGGQKGKEIERMDLLELVPEADRPTMWKLPKQD